MRKTQSLIPTNNAHNNALQSNGHQSIIGAEISSPNGAGGGGGGSESYSSASSFTESYSDSSDLANWEEYVAENGTLFYAEYSLSAQRPHEKRIEFARNSSLRMGKKNANSRKQQQQQQQQQQSGKKIDSAQQDEFRFANIRPRIGGGGGGGIGGNGAHAQQQQQQKQLELVITATDRYRFGRRSTAVESILGFRVVPFVDQPECLMVDSFVHEMPAMQHQQQQQQPIMRGDWFKSLDDIEVRARNVDELLLQFVEPTKVCLKFVGPAHDDTTRNEPFTGQDANSANVASTMGSGVTNDLRRIENFPMFAEMFEKLQLSGELGQVAQEGSAASITPLPFLLLILPPECYQNEQHKNSMFIFPELNGTNFLYTSRGSFLTLNAVLSAEMQTKPLSCKLLVADFQYYVCFRTLNCFLVLFAYAATYQSIMEANLRSDELINYMRFALPSLLLEHLSHNNPSSISLRQFLYHFCTVQRTRILSKHHYLHSQQSQQQQQQQQQKSQQGQQRRTVRCGAPPQIWHTERQCLFEELLRESRSLPLPKEAQLRIFDALSEMEAMDYRNWNDEPLNTHREFFIHGSVLYYDNFMLASQMTIEMRARVEGFLRCRGIFDFITDHCVKEFYAWEEIIPPECDGGGPEIGRFFLTVCSRSHLILAVVLKIFDAPDLSSDAVIPPSLFYIEEIQETLDHLISCGIESLAMFWSISNKRPEVLNNIEVIVGSDDDANANDSNKLESFIKQKLVPTASGSNQQQGRSIAFDEETHLCSSLGGSSIHSLTQSEDDSSRKRLSTVNSNNAGDNASDSGSDWDNFGEQNPLHYGHDAELQTQMTESLWKEINNVIPVKISAGWKNSVFHYVYVDNTNGAIFCPFKPTTKMTSNNGIRASLVGNNNTEVFQFLTEIRRACLVIRNVLQKTKNFRRLLTQEPATGANAGMQAIASNRIVGLPIKEHGITIQIHTKRDDSENCSNYGILKGNFVVVGRLFHTPTREVFVCHRPDVPQNIVEMAFRLSFFSVG